MTAPKTISVRERGKLRRAARIVDAACEVLREDGEDALTVERIARRAELSPGTVFNLIGTRDRVWATIGEKVLGDLDVEQLREIDDPHERARALMDAVVTMVCSDAAVHRALLLHWRHTARLHQHDPTLEFLGCLQDAADRGVLLDGLDLPRLAAHISTGLIGVMHQWASELIGDAALRARARDIVDVTFMAARAPGGPSQPQWQFKRTQAGRPSRVS